MRLVRPLGFCAIVLFGTTESALGQLLPDRRIYDPHSDQSPFVLLEVPDDGVRYYETRVRAHALFNERNWAQAEPLLESLVRAYPRDPFNWMLLGQTKRQLNKHLEAVAAFRHAGPLIGWDQEFPNGYRVAFSYLAAGDRRSALDALHEMIFQRHGFMRAALMRQTVFADLHDDPEFLTIAGRYDTTGLSRDEGWRLDIDFLYNETKRVNPDYRDKPFPAELTRRYEALKQDVPGLSDEEIFIGMARMLAVLHQGHVFLFADGSARVPNKFLPLRFYAFPEGVFIIDAGAGYEHLIGSRVDAIGSLGMEETMRRVSQATSVDSDMGYMWAAMRLSDMYYLRGMGASASRDSAVLTLQSRTGTMDRVTVTAGSAPRGRQDALLPPPAVTAPLYLQNMEAMHWERHLPEHDALYVQVNGLVDGPDETLPQFGSRLWDVLTGTQAGNLVLDLRHNPGGLTQLYPELLRTIIAFSRDPEKQLYVLIGRRTYSAAGNLVTDLERLARPIFVGEATGECCNLYGDPTYVVLPYSGVHGELTALKWQLSTPSDRRREMGPHVPVQLTADAFFRGEDPALEAVFRLIERARTQD
jgi:tetratricopeptide (TPR) repeat protein